MSMGLLAKKLGMTHVYDDFGRRIAVTVLKAGPCTVTSVREPQRDGYHAIESMELTNAEGKVVEKFGRSPVKFFIDIGSQANGVYYLKVNTNYKSETFPVILLKSK